ncbi:MAG: hypothetical protein NZ934_02345 [Hadesarchaea archaeon]|nr:hypothetical protein [Hadesarchaea archaeon]
MSEEVGEERLKKLAMVKSYLERRIGELSSEVEALRLLVSIVDEQLAAKSFKTVETIKREEKPRVVEVTKKEERPKELGAVRNLRGKSGNLLGMLTVTPDEIRLTVNPELRITSDMRPFSSFLIKKVLDNMVKVDRESVEAGKLEPSKELSYDIVYEGEEVREIIVRNYRDDVRLREVVNSIRWALDTISSSQR